MCAWVHSAVWSGPSALCRPWIASVGSKHTWTELGLTPSHSQPFPLPHNPFITPLHTSKDQGNSHIFELELQSANQLRGRERKAFSLIWFIMLFWKPNECPSDLFSVQCVSTQHPIYSDGLQSSAPDTPYKINIFLLNIKDGCIWEGV